MLADEHGLTPLCYAARYGKIDAVRVLLDAHGVCEDLISSSVDTLACVLDEAVAQDREEIVSLLLDEIHQTTSKGHDNLDPVYRSAMFKAVRGHKWAIAKLLVQASTSLDILDASGKTLLCQAVETGDVLFVQLLLECGAAVDSLDAEARTPLHIATEKGFVEIADCLLENGASQHERSHACE